MLRRILPALLLLACLALAAPGQARAEIRLDGVDVTIELTREDRIYVTERLQAFADAPNANHGMFRVIPLKPRFRERERRNVSFNASGSASAAMSPSRCFPPPSTASPAARTT